MNQALTKNIRCVVLYNGLEFWIENDRLNNLIQILESGAQKFLKIDDEIINTSQIVGIFSAQMMKERSRIKNGEWRCRFKNWHGKRENCECVNPEQEKKAKEFCESYFKANQCYPLNCWHSRNGRMHNY